MRQLHHHLLSPSLGTQRQVTSLHFGQGANGRKAYIQSSLHADELPGMLTAHKLRGLLEAAESAGEIPGEVVLVPVSNPIGLDQSLMHHQVGRFELLTMENFNRNYPDFFNLVKDRIAPKLTPDGDTNKDIVRAAMHEVLGEQVVSTELESLRRVLMSLACDADVVLDLHCDFEAILHMYVEQPMLDLMAPLARLLGAQTLLWARGSGPSISFDEALSGPWWRLQAHFADRAPIPLGCASTTVELRSQTDVSDAFATQDARAIVGYLRHAGVMSGPAPALPEPQCEPTPLAGTEASHAPHPGVIDFVAQVGERVAAGQLLARVIDPLAPRETEIRSSIEGIVYARHNLRWATTGMELCRVAGHTPIRSGNLLSP
ncbi:M14 family metallopeptidase [Hydrogenophaga pseudoflava]|uniref:M14 family metallopeptidase n=1 Tax=Hydrogenophaga pseudoflava TaxID=47421 RepID=UPI0027E4BCA4|nr:M14 family metallopeptidase [Hydrogenophaga pseudoflava]MDQ7744537.1 M14 family metallopeptidase [Hydrogenophaga pseudoflava]